MKRDLSVDQFFALLPLEQRLGPLNGCCAWGRIGGLPVRVGEPGEDGTQVRAYGPGRSRALTPSAELEVVRQQYPELLINQNIARAARTYAVADTRMHPLDVLIHTHSQYRCREC